MSSAADITEAIRGYVMDHGLGPGDRLPPERALAVTLDVSRPALREATSRLIDAGLLRSRQGSGTYIARVDLDELFAVRQRLEPFAAGLAAENASARDLVALARLAIELARSVDDANVFARVDLAIHDRIASASRNVVLLSTLSDLGQMLRFSRDQTAGDARTRAQALEDLTCLVDAIRGRNADRAEQMMSAHLANVRKASRGAA
jgi:GntR family transcriptional repressor for pyruvate dehydrogenase complex